MIRFMGGNVKKLEEKMNVFEGTGSTNPEWSQLYDVWQGLVITNPALSHGDLTHSHFFIVPD